MVELIKECKEAIKNNRCLGCTALENPKFMGNKNCEQLKINKGEQLKWNLKK